MVVHSARMSSMMIAEFELWPDDSELGVMQGERKVLRMYSDENVDGSNLV